MEIRFSKYNLPFSEPAIDGVHFIPVDCQLDMKAGRFNAHVQLYRCQPHTIEIYDSLTGSTNVHHLTGLRYVPPYVVLPEPELTFDEIQFLDELHYSSGIKAAGKRTKRCF